MLNFLKKKPAIPEDERLKKIISLLFPPLAVHITPNGLKYHIDYSADSNLDAALTDLEEGVNDAATQKTIRDVSDRLAKIRQILEAYREIDDEAKYIMVDIPDNFDPEEIVSERSD